jgi:hypothetical protein
MTESVTLLPLAIVALIGARLMPTTGTAPHRLCHLLARQFDETQSAKLSAVKLAGDPNNPARFKDDATADELREEIIKRLTALSEAGVLDLTAVAVPEDGIGHRAVAGIDQSSMNGK